ncbi:MAG TPA: 5'-nucleotidase C-terminal domain-containing protein [Pyrinomonadaceae bacterium]|nr:5'-nucleotidase C-terminal domain-containing protein [Pyrinomonadaceae bacterium]
MATIRPRARLAVLLLLLATLAAPHAALAQAAKPCSVRVTLLQVNDVYQFMPVERGAHGGVARLSTLRKRVKEESPNTLFLLAGDTISPSVESIEYKGRQMIDAWNAVGLDYSVFGNHEFDFGADELRKRVAESKFKWLGANVIEKSTGRTFAGTPVVEVREFDGVKLGLFGIVLPETATTSNPGPGVIFREACSTARAAVRRLRARGVGAIVALTHLSLEEDKQLARCAPGIDLIVGGHEHTLLQSSSAGVPIFKMTADGREAGQFDLHINPATGKVESLDWKVIPVNSDIPEDPEFAAAMQKYEAKQKELAVTVGRTDVALDARSAPNRTGETNVASFIADAFREAAGADVALLNGGSIRADTIISRGELSLRDVLSILPFGGALVKIEVTGETLRKALEHGLSNTRPGAEPGRFPQVSGVRYSFDATRAPGSRLVEVTVGGRPLEAQKTYTLVTSKYVAEGGDQYDMFKGAPNLLTEKLTDSGVLRSAIAAAPNQTIAPRTDGRVRRLDEPASQAPCKPAAAAARPAPARARRRR